MGHHSTYFVIESGPSLAWVRDWLDQRNGKAPDAWKTYAEKYGAVSAMYGNTFRGIRLQGLVFEPGKIPDGWKQIKGQKTGVAEPDRRIKGGKALCDEMAALPAIPNDRDLSRYFFGAKGEDIIVDGRAAIAASTAEDIGGQVVVTVRRAHEGDEVDEPKKDGDVLRRLKTSEYHAMKGD